MREALVSRLLEAMVHVENQASATINTRLKNMVVVAQRVSVLAVVAQADGRMVKDRMAVVLMANVHLAVALRVVLPVNALAAAVLRHALVMIEHPAHALRVVLRVNVLQVADPLVALVMIAHRARDLLVVLRANALQVVGLPVVLAMIAHRAHVLRAVLQVNVLLLADLLVALVMIAHRVLDPLVDLLVVVRQANEQQLVGLPDVLRKLAEQAHLVRLPVENLANATRATRAVKSNPEKNIKLFN